MIQDFKETDHPRDKDGKFASGSSETSADKTGTGTGTGTIKSKEIIVKGDELGEYGDIKELRKLAIDYYKSNIQGTIIKRDDIGEVKFSRKGIDETISKAKDDEEVLKLIPYLPNIIKTAKLLREEKPNHERKDNIDKFISLTNNIKIGGNNKDVEILLKHEDGYWHYALYLNRKREVKYPAQGTGLNSCNPTIPSTNEKVNSFNAENEQYTLNLFFINEDNNTNKTVSTMLNTYNIYNTYTNFKLLNAESVRTIDENGFLFVEKSPILKVGVMEYSGSELLDGKAGNIIDGVEIEPKRIYKLNISNKELEKSINNWKIAPIVNDHTFLGVDGKNAKGRQEGAIGENVYIEDGKLYAPLRFTNLDTVKKIQDGVKQELSTAYSNNLIRSKNSDYDFEVVDIIPNHLALVDKGRAGSDVRVLNSININNNKEEMKNIYTMNEKEVSADEMLDTLKKEAVYHKDKPVDDKSEKAEDKKDNKSKNEDKDDDKKENKACNEDKRKLIDEIGGILKGKVDEEIIKTIMAKAEKLSYESSENKAKNAGEEVKDKDDKKDILEEENKSKNKTKNSLDFVTKNELTEILENYKSQENNKFKAFNEVKKVIGDFDATGLNEKGIYLKALNEKGIDVEANESLESIKGMFKLINSNKVKLDNSFSYSKNADFSDLNI